MSNEGMPSGQERFERGPSAAPVEVAAEREFVRESKGQEYKELQMKIVQLEADLNKGNEKTAQETNPGMRELAIQIGRKLTEELEVLQKRKQALEEEIRGVGGNPSDYTVQ